MAKLVEECRHPDALLIHALRALNRLSLTMESENQSAATLNDSGMTGLLNCFVECPDTHRDSTIPLLTNSNVDKMLFKDEEIGRSFAPMPAASFRQTPSPLTRSASRRADSVVVPQSSPKRPSEEPPEENRVSPKRLSLQFRPDRIASTSTPFQGRLGAKSPLKGARALDFETPVKSDKETDVINDDTVSVAPSDKTCNQRLIPSAPFVSPDQSILAHGFPPSFFYSPRKSASRNAGARPKESVVGTESGRRSCGGSGLLSTSSKKSSWLPNFPLSGGDLVGPDPRPSPYYSFYETESGYFTRSRCRDVRDEIETQWASTSLEDSSARIHRHGSTDGNFCCVPDTPSHIFLRRPVSRAKLITEKESEEATKREEIHDRVDDHCRGLKTDRWIGRRMGLETVDVIAELKAFEPHLVIRLMKLLDDADLKSFSLVSTAWKEALDEHGPSRKRLQEHDDRQLALWMQNQENLEDKFHGNRSVLKSESFEDSYKSWRDAEEREGPRHVKPRTSMSTPTLGSPSRRALTPRSVNASPYPGVAASTISRASFSPRRRLQTPATSSTSRVFRSGSSAEALHAATRSLIGLFDSPATPTLSSVPEHERHPSETKGSPFTRSKREAGDSNKNSNDKNDKSHRDDLNNSNNYFPFGHWTVNDASARSVPAKDVADSTPKTNRYLQSPASLLHRKTMTKSQSKSSIKSKQKLRRL